MDILNLYVNWILWRLSAARRRETDENRPIRDIICFANNLLPPHDFLQGCAEYCTSAGSLVLQLQQLITVLQQSGEKVNVCLDTVVHSFQSHCCFVKGEEGIIQSTAIETLSLAKAGHRDRQPRLCVPWPMFLHPVCALHCKPPQHPNKSFGAMLGVSKNQFASSRTDWKLSRTQHGNADCTLSVPQTDC